MASYLYGVLWAVQWLQARADATCKQAPCPVRVPSLLA